MSAFPVLWQPHSRAERLELEQLATPRSVPWSLVAPHEEQAQRNHGQSLARLAERGGLSVGELCAILEDRRWRSMPAAEAVTRLRELLAAHAPEHP